MKSLRFWLPYLASLALLITLTVTVFGEDKPAPAASPAPPATLNQSEQLTLAISQLNQEIANLRQQLSNAQRELTYTKSCHRSGIAIEHCVIQADGTIISDAPPPAPVAEAAKPAAK